MSSELSCWSLLPLPEIGVRKFVLVLDLLLELKMPSCVVLSRTFIGVVEWAFFIAVVRSLLLLLLSSINCVLFVYSLVLISVKVVFRSFIDGLEWTVVISVLLFSIKCVLCVYSLVLISVADVTVSKVRKWDVFCIVDLASNDVDLINSFVVVLLVAVSRDQKGTQSCLDNKVKSQSVKCIN